MRGGNWRHLHLIVFFLKKCSAILTGQADEQASLEQVQLAETAPVVVVFDARLAGRSNRAGAGSPLSPKQHSAFVCLASALELCRASDSVCSFARSLFAEAHCQVCR
mmetsp:Transcript_25085/g.45642  ORF Transcript_25085/g.45642 Transcript_25085/m.45642 type:complete len:107 (+) Transcript_25085:119-439(+)